jgi:hypothetical protein
MSAAIVATLPAEYFFVPRLLNNSMEALPKTDRAGSRNYYASTNNFDLIIGANLNKRMHPRTRRGDTVRSND